MSEPTFASDVGDTISVVICAHSERRLALLRDAIRSVLEQRCVPHEVFVVVDHNPALLAQVTVEFPEVVVMPNVAGHGLSGARNTGLQQAGGTVVAFLDDDAVAAPDWCQRMLAHYEDQRVMGVGGKAIPVWPTKRPEWFPAEFDWVVGCNYKGMPQEAAAVRNLIGCNMSFRRFVFARAGLFRTGMGREGENAAGCEETDLCIRAAVAFPQARIVYDPEVIVYHKIAQERTSWRYFRARCLGEGRSKALMISMIGSQHGLANERRQMMRVLPLGIWHGIRDFAVSLELAGIRRAGAILAGSSMVLGAYLKNRKGAGGESQRDTPFAPIQILEIDTDTDLPSIAARNPQTGGLYGGVLCAVWSGGQLSRLVELPLYGENLPPSRVAKLLAINHSREQTASLAAAPRARENQFVRIVIATRDRANSLRRCLDSLSAQSHPQFEIVVVDNAPSGPQTRDLIEQRYAGSGRINYMREDRPGLGHAHNRGLTGNGADVVAFTDDDVLVDRSWLASLLQAFSAAANVGCVTGLILPAELETKAQYWTERHGGFGKGLVQRIFDLQENRPKGLMFPFSAGHFGSGANMAFTGEALRKIGGFDGALGAGTIAKGGDDLAAFVTVLRAGYQLVYEPQAIVWHHHRRSEEGMRRQAYGYGVGLGAFLSKFLLEEPSLLLHYGRALPEALVHMLSNGSTKNARLPTDYPARWKWNERAGVVAGLPAYLRSRSSLRRHQEISNAAAPVPKEQSAS